MCTPFFSVVIPLFNKAAYVDRALDSIFAQSWRDFELVVVDDESVDGSLEAVKQYFGERGGVPPNVKIIEQQHAGVGAARNNGVAKSAGKYLAFLDADDWWCEGYLESMQSLIGRWPQEEIFGTSYYIMNDGELRIAPIALDPLFEEGLVVYHEVYDRSEELCMPLTANSYCITRNAFEEVGGYRTDLTLGEDLYLWLKVTLRHPLAFLNRPLSVYSHDVDPSNRAIGRLHKPVGHVIFNLEEFRDEEEKFPLLKKLLDRMRVGTIGEYYPIEAYRKEVLKLMEAVDWDNQS